MFCPPVLVIPAPDAAPPPPPEQVDALFSLAEFIRGESSAAPPPPPEQVDALFSLAEFIRRESSAGARYVLLTLHAAYTATGPAWGPVVALDHINSMDEASLVGL